MLSNCELFRFNRISIIFRLNTENAIKNLSMRSLDSTLKKTKFTSLLDKDIFSEMPFFYKKCVFNFFNNLDREMEGKSFSNDLMNQSTLNVLQTLSPEISVDPSLANINSKHRSQIKTNHFRYRIERD
jgi:hypothetical protein